MPLHADRASSNSARPIQVAVVRLPHAADIPLPSRATPGSAGYDLRAAVPDSVTLLPGERALIPTGICIAIPAGYEGQVRPRSGLALRHGIGMVNAPGTIDSDYRGEIAVLLVNLGSEDATIRRGDRIAQLVIAPVAEAVLAEVTSLDETSRGAGGFGHSGT